MSRPRTSEPEDINLIPLMNLFVTMIPLLLMSAAFYHIGMIATSVPTQSEGGDTNVPTGKTQVSANVKITARGYNLTTSSATLSDDELKAFDAFIPKKGKSYDTASLSGALERIKRRYEASDTLMVIPSKTTTFDDMVKTMDAARNMTIKTGKKTRKIALFPVVVVTTLVE